VGLERGPLSLVRINEGLLEWKSSDSGSRKPQLTVVGSVALTRDTLYSQRLARTSQISGGRSVGIVRLRTKATEFSLVLQNIYYFAGVREFDRNLRITSSNTNHLRMTDLVIITRELFFIPT
jgi:hypothetical protein